MILDDKNETKFKDDEELLNYYEMKAVDIGDNSNSLIQEDSFFYEKITNE